MRLLSFLIPIIFISMAQAEQIGEIKAQGKGVDHKGRQGSCSLELTKESEIRLKVVARVRGHFAFSESYNYVDGAYELVRGGFADSGSLVKEGNVLKATVSSFWIESGFLPNWDWTELRIVLDSEGQPKSWESDGLLSDMNCRF